MQSRSILFLVLVVVLAGLSAWRVAKWPFTYGLDVQGGLRLVYRMDTEHMSKEDLGRQAMIQSDLVKILDGRARGTLGASEPSVMRKGEDSFVVELPGMTDIARATEIMSTTAKIEVKWAKTVGTDLYPNRRYKHVPNQRESDKVKYETYVKSSDPSKVLEPGDPDYKAMIASWETILEGKDVAGASPEVSGNGSHPKFFFSPSGAAKMEQWSRKYMNKRENIAFVLDDRVLNMAYVKDGTVLSDEAFLDGTFPAGYVNDLCNLVRSGSLPVALVPLSTEKVDPTIGKQALNEMEKAGAISFAIVGVLLVIYYGFPGVIAFLAMLLYTVFTLAFLNLISATMSLAAIAAFILSVGMAVDANILVFERLKEELREGKDLARATSIAFKRALTAIIDSNACTVLTCAVLYFYGTGPVKGFASTLGLGVFISFFTAFVVTRVLVQGSQALGIGRNPKWYGMGKGWFLEQQKDDATHHLLNIIGRTKFYFIVSAALIIPGLVFIGLGGIKLNVEFLGGYEGMYKLPAGLTTDQIRKNLSSKGIEGVNIKGADTEKGKVVYLTVPPLKDMAVGDNSANERIASAAGLSTEGSSFSAIGPTVQKETVNNAVMGVGISSLLIAVYLAFRFGISVGGIRNGFKFGASAVIALVHDVLFVIGTAAIVGYFLHWEISALFITAMLTVIGFSVHDTIIIFDRIRENLNRQHKGESFEHLCDKSVTQSVARSINTSMSAVIPLAVLIAIGTPTPDLKFMCLSMLLGISIGAYSSIFNATPILYIWDKIVMKKRGEGAGLMAEAAREIKVRAQAAATAAGAMPAAATATGAATGAGSAYGQIKRRSSAVEQSKREIDDED
ncbi:MAG: protein translocase subunit SecD [Armatimonadetes bacterium]|nr:protein translocase subunit SecD [Armatimonadota bacterium]